VAGFELVLALEAEPPDDDEEEGEAENVPPADEASPRDGAETDPPDGAAWPTSAGTGFAGSGSCGIVGSGSAGTVTVGTVGVGTGSGGTGSASARPARIPAATRTATAPTRRIPPQLAGRRFGCGSAQREQLSCGHQTRLLRSPRPRSGRRRGGGQARVPCPRPRLAPRRRRVRGGGGALPGARRGLLRPVEARGAPPLRPVRLPWPRQPGLRRGAVGDAAAERRARRQHPHRDRAAQLRGGGGDPADRQLPGPRSLQGVHGSRLARSTRSGV
jgi:hypothetical protein